MKTIKGPGIFLAQFVGAAPPFDSLDGLARWASGLGYVGLQLPTTAGLFDLEKAATSQTYADELKGRLGEAGVEITELSTHIQGQLVAVHPAYDQLFDGFAPETVRGNPSARTEWATRELKLAAEAERAGTLCGRTGHGASPVRRHARRRPSTMEAAGPESKAPPAER